MPRYCILTLEKIHSYGSLQARRKHNRREYDLKNVDPAMSMFNEELIPSHGLDYKTLWKNRIREVELKTETKIKPRANAVLAVEIVLTYSEGVSLNVNEWKEANLRWLKSEFGEDNIIAATLHVDEITPHIHAIMVPVDDRNRLCAKSFFGSRKQMFDLQDSYAKAMEPFGLERGERFTRARKQNLGRFYAAVEKAANAKAPERLPDEPADVYMERVNEYIQNVELKALKETTDIKREADVASSRLAQIKNKYSDAIKLQDELEEAGGEEFAKERITAYRAVEKSAPKEFIKRIIENTLNKFPSEMFEQWLMRRRKDKDKNKEKTDTAKPESTIHI